MVGLDVCEAKSRDLEKVKAEKVDRKEFWATLKKKKYDRTKEQLEPVAFGDDDDKANGAAMQAGGFFSCRGFFPNNYNIISARFTSLSCLLLQ